MLRIAEPATVAPRLLKAVMFSRFFIERPIFANVIAIVTMIVGAVALFRLPIERYPNITPPTVTVSASYPAPTPKRSRTPWPHQSSRK